jgi:hypothetical protein
MTPGLMGSKTPGRMFVSQVSAGEKGRPKAVAGWIEIAAGDKDARRRAVWLTEKGALSLEAGLADWKRAHKRTRQAPGDWLWRRRRSRRARSASLRERLQPLSISSRARGACLSGMAIAREA